MAPIMRRRSAGSCVSVSSVRCNVPCQRVEPACLDGKGLFADQSCSGQKLPRLRSQPIQTPGDVENAVRATGGIRMGRRTVTRVELVD